MTDHTNLIAFLRASGSVIAGQGADALEALQSELTKALYRAKLADNNAARCQQTALDALNKGTELRAEVDRLTTEKKAAAMNHEARLSALEGQKPEFWWRPFDDGSYLGPLHDDSIEEVRKLSQEWKPLFVAAGAAPTKEPNNDEVICPACVHQFRAIPVNVQKLMLDAGFEPPFTEAPKQEPVAYFNFQEHGFYWAQNTKIGDVPVSIKVAPMPLYSKEQT